MEATPLGRKLPATILFFIAGILVGGGIMYHLGYMHGAEGAAFEIRQCRERLELVSNALERAVNEKTQMEEKVLRLHTQMNDLKNMLLEVLDSLSRRFATGEADDVEVTVPAIVTTRGREFCVEVRVKNNSELQKILNIKLSGMGVISEQSAQSVGPKTSITLPVCGEVERSVAKVSVSVNGEDVVSFYVLVTEGE